MHVSSNNRKLDIFKIYTKRAVENVQDVISRPLGSQEIHEIKVPTVLRDTLYLCFLARANYSMSDFVS